MTFNEKKIIIEKLKTYNVSKSNNVQLSNNYQHFFPHLNVYDEIFQCKKCFKLLRNKKEILTHLNQVHNIKNQLKNQEKSYESNLYAQTFFTNQYKKYFLVLFKNQYENNDINNNNQK